MAVMPRVALIPVWRELPPPQSRWHRDPLLAEDRGRWRGTREGSWPRAVAGTRDGVNQGWIWVHGASTPPLSRGVLKTHVPGTLQKGAGEHGRPATPRWHPLTLRNRESSQLPFKQNKELKLKAALATSSEEPQAAVRPHVP